MFKFNKPVDQELEQGEISDDNQQVLQSTVLPQPVQRKTPPIPQLNNQQQDSPEYVIEQVKIVPSSPTPDRKKQRKDVKAQDIRYDKKYKISRSPQNIVFQTPSILQPPMSSVPPMQQINQYYSYPSSNIFPYNQPIQDQRQFRYQSHPSISPSFQNQTSFQRNTIAGQWNGQSTMPQNKLGLQNNISQFAPRPQSYVYNQNFPQIQQTINYSQGSNFNANLPQQPQLNMINSQKYPGQYQQQTNYQIQQQQQLQQQQIHQQQFQQQKQFQHQQLQMQQYQQQQQQIILQQKRRLQIQQQEAVRQRNIKVIQIQKQIKQKIKSENEGERQNMGEILMIIKGIVEQEEIGKSNIERIYKIMEQKKLKQKVYEMLQLLQLKEIVQNLKQMQLSSKLIQNEKKKQIQEIYKRLNKKDPRIKVT